MKILCINDAMGSCPSFRARALAYQPFFDINNIQITHISQNRYAPIKYTKDYDLVLLRRITFGKKELNKINVPIIFDFDDAIYHAYRKEFNDTVQSASIVLAGSQTLANEANNSGSNHTEILRTGVNVLSYPIATHDYKQLCVWTGSSSTLQHLETISKDLSGINIRVICDKFSKLINSENIHWNINTQYSGLKNTSIGLAPLPDTPYTRGKCGFKIIQYMAAGLPVVATGIGANKELFDDYGIKGRCVNDNIEFVSALKLLNDFDIKEFGKINRLIAEKHFDLSVFFPKLLNVINGLQ